MAHPPTIVGAVNLLPERDGEVLLARRFQTGWEDGNYSVVGGHVEVGETPLEAAIREGLEEINIRFTGADLRFVTAIHRRYPAQDRIDYFFALSNWEGEPVNQEPAKCDDLAWFAPDALPDNLVHYIGQAITNYQSGKGYSEIDYRGDQPIVT